MIGIKLDGESEFLEVPPNVVISLKLENPLLNESEKVSPGSYSLPFNLPGGDDSPVNSRMLKNPDVLENNESYTIQKATLFYGGVPYKKGTLKASSTENNQISTNFLFGLSQVSPEFKKAKLRDILSETIEVAGTALTKKIFVKKTAGGDWKITVNGKEYTAASAFGLKVLINADNDASLDTGKYLPYATEVTVGTSPSGLIAATYLEIKPSLYYTYYDPFLEMEFFLRQDSTDPLHELHVTTDKPDDYLVESVSLDGYYDAFDAFLAGYISGAYPTEKFRFPVRFNADPYGEAGIKEGETINGIDAAIVRNDPNWGLNNAAPFQVKNYNSLQPFIRLKWVLDKIATYFNFQLEGDFYNHADLPNILLDNTASLDVPQNYIGNKKFVFWKNSFNMNELVPDVTVVDFLLALKSRYNLAIDYNEATLKVRMKLREAIALSTGYEDITSLCSPVKGSTDERITGFTLRQLKESKDAFSAEQSYSVGVPEDDIPIKCGQISTTGIATLNDISVLGPRVSMKNGETFGLRVFTYRGIVDDIPQASINDIDDISSLTELYTTCWKYWLLFKTKRRHVNIDVRYPFRMIRNFNWEVKKRFNRLNYIVKSIDVKLTNSGISVSGVELITMS